MRSTPQKRPRLGQLSDGLQPLGGGGGPGLHFGGQVLVHGGDGELADHRGVGLNGLIEINVPDDEVALGIHRHPAVIGVDELQGVAGEEEFLLEGVVGVAHGPHGDEGGPDLPGQLVPEDAQGVRLGGDPVKVWIAVPVAAAVAVQTAVAAPPVQVHRVVGAEPGGGFAADEDVFGGDVVHGKRLPQCVV